MAGLTGDALAADFSLSPSSGDGTTMSTPLAGQPEVLGPRAAFGVSLGTRTPRAQSPNRIDLQPRVSVPVITEGAGDTTVSTLSLIHI